MIRLCMCALSAVMAVGVSYIPILEQLKHLRGAMCSLDGARDNVCSLHRNEATTSSGEHVHFRGIHLLMHVTPSSPSSQ
jgi:hypothetical protein